MSEIKIEMTFEEAVEITQETYNRYNKKDIKNQIGKFDFYDEYFDNEKFFSSNFSGITYIREYKNSLNVAIACRGSSKNWKDWVQNLLIIPLFPNTCADNKAKQYAIDILNKIKNDDKYKDKKINIITLGHSKGGREAQKQMVALLDKCNICCLTFNSAPIVNIIENIGIIKNKSVSKYNDFCQNLVISDGAFFGKDTLAMRPFGGGKMYGKTTPYKIQHWATNISARLHILLAILLSSFVLSNLLTLWMNFITSFIVSLTASVVLLWFSLYKKRQSFLLIYYSICIGFLLYNCFCKQNQGMIFNMPSIDFPISNWLLLTCYGIFISIIMFLTIKYLHGMEMFKYAKTDYEKLKNTPVSEIIHAKDLQSLVNQNPPKK